jgi:hypothetical protein
MAASASAAYAIYPQNVALNEVLQTLRQGGFDKESICMMLSPSHPIAATVREANMHAFEREANTLTARLIGWLSEFGAVVIPTFGFFIRSQAFFRALVAEQDSISRCGRSGTLAGLGFPEDDARRFENQVRKDGALLYVSCPETAQKQQWVLELMRATGAEEAGLLQNNDAVETAV